MRVAVDATSWSDPRGFGRFTRNAVARLAARPGVECILVTDREEAPNIKAPEGSRLLVTAAAGRGPRAAAALARAVRRAQADVVLFPSLLTWFPAPGTPSVVGLHDASAERLPREVLGSAPARAAWGLKRRLAIRMARRLFTVSLAAREEIAAVLGLDRSRLAVVPEAPDPAFYPRSAQESSQAAAEAGLADGEPYLLFAAGISPHKGLDTLIEAIALEPEAPRLVIAGDLGRTRYRSAAADLQAAIAAHGLDGRVRLAGFLSDEALARLLSGAAAAVIPSRAEGFGLPAVEAAACGAPVIASDLPAHRETLGSAAALFQPGDAAGLAAAIRSAAGNRELAERGRAAVAELSWDATAQALEQVLAEAAR